MSTTEKNKLHIFLDIDGVLNNEEHYVNGDALLPNGDYTHFSPKLVSMFNNMCDEISHLFDVRIVLSSSHRIGLSDEQCTDYLKKNGVKYGVFGRTKYFNFSMNFKHLRIPRGVEVDEYINEHNIEHYIILDDDGDFLLGQDGFFFQTNSFIGLTEDIVNDILKFTELLNIEIEIKKGA